MSNILKEMSKWSLFLFITLVLSCVGVEKKSLSDQRLNPSQGVTNPRDALEYAYQNYAFACLAILNENYRDAETYLKEALKSDKESPYLLTKLSQVLLENDKKEEALLFVQKALDINPAELDAMVLLAGIYSQLEKFELAISQYRRALQDDPTNTEARLQLSTLFIRTKDYDSALEQLSIVIKDDPDLLIAHYYMGRINMERGEYPGAERAFRRVLEINPEFLPVLFDLATLYSGTNRIDMAIGSYKRILELSPTNAAARERLIALYYKTGQEKLAEDAIEEMKKRFGLGDPKRKRLGLIYLRYGKLDESIVELTAIVAASPEDQEARYYLGAALEESGDLDGAYEHLNQINPDSDYFLHARMRMAYILEKQERTDEGIHLLRNTIKLQEGNPRLYLMLSSLYEVKEQYHSALSVLEEGLEYNQKDTGLLYRTGIVLDRLERNEECLKHMELIIEIDPKHADALNYIGYTYADKGIHLDRAQDLIERAIQYKPNSGYIIDSLGWVYFRKGLYDKALIELKRAVELTPGDPTIHEHLGDVYFKREEYEKALGVYKKTIALENADQERLRNKIKDVMEHLEGIVP
jgi:tetratricopeptide (TPR) repeat protein